MQGCRVVCQIDSASEPALVHTDSVFSVSLGVFYIEYYKLFTFCCRRKIMAIRGGPKCSLLRGCDKIMSVYVTVCVLNCFSEGEERRRQRELKKKDGLLLVAPLKAADQGGQEAQLEHKLCQYTSPTSQSHSWRSVSSLSWTRYNYASVSVCVFLCIVCVCGLSVCRPSVSCHCALYLLSLTLCRM